MRTVKVEKLSRPPLGTLSHRYVDRLSRFLSQKSRSSAVRYVRAPLKRGEHGSSASVECAFILVLTQMDQVTEP
jgi:hypothetical protein